MTTATPVLASTAASWYDDFCAAGGTAGRGADYMIAEAARKAEQYVEIGTAYDDFQPGNGTRYLIVLHDLVRPWLDHYYRQHDEPPTDPAEQAAFREYAASKTMAARAGGELLVSLPETYGGRSAVFSIGPADTNLFTPDYIEQRLGLRWADALPLAVYLSAFADEVARLRAA